MRGSVTLLVRIWASIMLKRALADIEPSLMKNPLGL
jgi:hypothetical protein